MGSLRTPDGKLLTPPIYGDHGRRPVRLDMPGTQADLRRHGIELIDGRQLLLFADDGDDDGCCDDLIAVGTARYDYDERRWVADIPEDGYLHYSDLDDDVKVLWRYYRPENGQHSAED